jgi:hypothetical protein
MSWARFICHLVCLCVCAARQLEVESQQASALVNRLQSEKAAFSSAVVDAQGALQRIQQEKDKLTNMLKLEEGVSSRV